MENDRFNFHPPVDEKFNIISMGNSVLFLALKVDLLSTLFYILFHSLLLVESYIKIKFESRFESIPRNVEIEAKEESYRSADDCESETGNSSSLVSAPSLI